MKGFSPPLLLFAVFICGCASHMNDAQIEKRYVVTYYDRNHDGIVDFELHVLPGGADADWALTDTRFRGRYDLRLGFGMGIYKTRVDIPVPKNVKITPGRPPVSERVLRLHTTRSNQAMKRIATD